MEPVADLSQHLDPRGYWARPGSLPTADRLDPAGIDQGGPLAAGKTAGRSRWTVDIPASDGLERRALWFPIEAGIRGLRVPDERGYAVCSAGANAGDVGGVSRSCLVPEGMAVPPGRSTALRAPPRHGFRSAVTLFAMHV